MADSCTLAVQRGINEYHQHLTTSRNTGTLDLAWSTANGAALEVDATGRNRDGKDVNFSVTYPVDQCDAPVTDGSVDCDSAASAVTLTECVPYTGMTQISSAKFEIDKNQYRDTGALEGDTVVQKKIYDQMDRILESINIAALTFLCANVGCFSTGVPSKQVKFIDGATGAPNFGVDQDIMWDFADAGYMVNPLIVGGRVPARYQAAIQRNALGMNLSGTDLSTMQDFSIFYDNHFGAGVCESSDPANFDAMIALMPNIFNVLNYTDNRGQFRTRNSDFSVDSYSASDLWQRAGTFEWGTIVHPRTGWEFDLNTTIDNCGKFTMYLNTYYKFVLLPIKGCKDACFNGAVKYDVCPITNAC